MKTLNEFKNDVERELMVKVIMGLRHGKISKEKAQSIAREYIKLREAENSEQLFENMASLIIKYSEILDVYLKTASEYFMYKTNQLLNEGRKYMKIEQYDLAVDALQGKVTNHE